jgi:hypothetical protein
VAVFAGQVKGIQEGLFQHPFRNPLGIHIVAALLDLLSQFRNLVLPDIGSFLDDLENPQLTICFECVPAHFLSSCAVLRYAPVEHLACRKEKLPNIRK